RSCSNAAGDAVANDMLLTGVRGLEVHLHGAQKGEFGVACDTRYVAQGGSGEKVLNEDEQRFQDPSYSPPWARSPGGIEVRLSTPLAPPPPAQRRNNDDRESRAPP
ncbi:hypothetical protein THAOC_12751, partial [Thalassiosira oceanica]